MTAPVRTFHRHDGVGAVAVGERLVVGAEGETTSVGLVAVGWRESVHDPSGVEVPDDRSRAGTVPGGEEAAVVAVCEIFGASRVATTEDAFEAAQGWANRSKRAQIPALDDGGRRAGPRGRKGVRPWASVSA